MFLARRSFALALAGLATGCGPSRPSRVGGKLAVVASFSILGDLASTIGGAHVNVQSLIGPNEDGHGFDPKPSDIRALGQAQLIIQNGLNYEGWIDRLIETSGSEGTLVTASDEVVPLTNSAKLPDPHAWQSFHNIKAYARAIEAGLARVAPALASRFAKNRVLYEAKVDTSLVRAKAHLASIPLARRLIVVPHDSFAYLGAELGLQFRGLRALSAQGQSSAAGLRELIAEIKASGAAAAFVENINDERLVAQISSQTGTKIGGKLYSDALSLPNGPAPTTLAMLNHNVSLITAALTS